MNYQDLPVRWKQKLAEYLRTKGINERIELNAYDFTTNNKAVIKFEDDSFAEFRYSIIIMFPENNEIGLFTEHCGYHIFNMSGTSIELINVDEMTNLKRDEFN